VNIAHFKELKYGVSIYHLNTHLGEKRQVEQLAKLVRDRSKGDSVAFWSGTFNTAEKNEDLLDVFEERESDDKLSTFNDRKADLIGTYKSDARVRAKGLRVSGKQNSEHRFPMAIYTISGLKGGYVDPSYVGSPTNPNQDPEAPKPVKQKFEKDNGPQRDHTECCGGEAL